MELVTKFGKLTAVCGTLFLMVCCMVLSGCHKAQQQGNAYTTGPAVDSEVSNDDDLILEVETYGTVNSSGSTTQSTTQSGTTKHSGSAAQSKTQSGTKHSGSAAQSTQTTETTDTDVTTTRTTQDGWTPDLGKKTP